MVLIAAVRGTGRGDADTRSGHTRLHRLVWLFASVMALVSIAWISDVPRQRPSDWTPYHNDTIALTECAARLVLEGRDPYASLDVFDCYAELGMPFILWHPADWLEGVTTPLSEPMFPRGAGIILLGTNGGLLLLPASAYLALDGLCALVCLGVAWRARRTSPELGVVLALVPLFFAWRSLFSYFFLVPLFAAVAVARMPLGDLTPERARAAGALTLFALPARRLALVARRGRAA